MEAVNGMFELAHQSVREAQSSVGGSVVWRDSEGLLVVGQGLGVLPV